MNDPYNRIAAGDVGRVAALSDGVFAFALTVLVLDIHTPEAADIHSEAQLLNALAAQAPHLLTWLLRLMTLGIFWVGQQTQLNQLKHADRDLTWLHFLFLAFVTALPFSTRLLSEFFAYRTAFLIYWANILLCGVAVYATWAYAVRAKLVHDDLAPEHERAIRRRIVVAQCLYALGALAGLVHTIAGLALIVAIQLNYAIAPRLFRRARAVNPV